MQRLGFYVGSGFLTEMIVGAGGNETYAAMAG
jgi:hypothetical protein